MAHAQESRLAIFRLLVKRGSAGYTPTQLGEKLNVPAPTPSFHLQELQGAGLINVRRDGRLPHRGGLRQGDARVDRFDLSSG